MTALTEADLDRNNADRLAHGLHNVPPFVPGEPRPKFVLHPAWRDVVGDRDDVLYQGHVLSAPFTRARVSPEPGSILPEALKPYEPEFRPFLANVPAWAVWAGIFTSMAFALVFIGYFGWHVAKWLGVGR